jgi:hypothetical protein
MYVLEMYASSAREAVLEKGTHGRVGHPYDVCRGARDVTARLAYGVARLTDVTIDDLLAGALLSPRTCPHMPALRKAAG